MSCHLQYTVSFSAKHLKQDIQLKTLNLVLIEKKYKNCSRISLRCLPELPDTDKPSRDSLFASQNTGPKEIQEGFNSL